MRTLIIVQAQLEHTVTSYVVGVFRTFAVITPLPHWRRKAVAWCDEQDRLAREKMRATTRPSK